MSNTEVTNLNLYDTIEISNNHNLTVPKGDFYVGVFKFRESYFGSYIMDNPNRGNKPIPEDKKRNQFFDYKLQHLRPVFGFSDI